MLRAVTRPPTRSTLFPYTTLFRSRGRGVGPDSIYGIAVEVRDHLGNRRIAAEPVVATITSSMRSEEHTSELQSPDHLVCRLLLEKKNEIDAALLELRQSHGDRALR